MISSGIQYERATVRSSERQELMADAGRRAALANAQNAKLNSSALPDVERRLQACSLVITPASESRRSCRRCYTPYPYRALATLQAAFAAAGTFDEAAGVLNVQDDLYRKFKIKYASVLSKEYAQDIDDTI